LWCRVSDADGGGPILYGLGAEVETIGGARDDTYAALAHEVNAKEVMERRNKESS